MTPGNEPTRILFVCTANICRSPAAEVLARHQFGETEAVFRSAGFLEDGRECPAFLVQSLGDWGVDASHHRSYKLDPASLNAADLVLTMEGEHVQRATLLDRDSFAKIVPLKEAAAHLSRLIDDKVAIDAFLGQLNQQRDPTSYLSSVWDVDDPYRMKLKDYRRAVDEIAGLVSSVVGRLV